MNKIDAETAARKRIADALDAANQSPVTAARALGISKQAMHKAMVRYGIPHLSENEKRALRGTSGADLKVWLSPRHDAALAALGGPEKVALAMRRSDPVEEAWEGNRTRRTVQLTAAARARLLAVAEAHNVSEAQAFRAAIERAESFLRESAKSS